MNKTELITYITKLKQREQNRLKLIPLEQTEWQCYGYIECCVEIINYLKGLEE